MFSFSCICRSTYVCWILSHRDKLKFSVTDQLRTAELNQTRPSSGLRSCTNLQKLVTLIYQPWDPTLRPIFFTQHWYPVLEPNLLFQTWDPAVMPSLWTELCYPTLEPHLGTHHLDPPLGHNLGI